MKKSAETLMRRSGTGMMEASRQGPWLGNIVNQLGQETDIITGNICVRKLSKSELIQARMLRSVNFLAGLIGCMGADPGIGKRELKVVLFGGKMGSRQIHHEDDVAEAERFAVAGKSTIPANAGGNSTVVERLVDGIERAATKGADALSVQK